MRAGVDLAANLIGATLGPGGRNVAYTRSLSAPRLTNDGAIIANELEEVRDPVLDLGLQLMRRAAQTADDTSGDGTTTAVVLAQAIVHRGLYNIAAGANGVRLRDGLERGAAAAIAALRDLARPVESTEQLRHVATVSSEDEPLGRLIAEMAAAVGPDGLIMADFHRGTGRLQARYIDGMQIDRGWLSPFFNEGASRVQVTLEEPLVLLTDRDLDHERELVPVLDKLRQSGRATILVVAKTVRDRALHLLLHNRAQGTLNVIAIKAPSFGLEMCEMLEDLAALTGATVVSEGSGVAWDDVPLAWLGSCRRVVVNREATVILEGQGRKAEIQDRLLQLRTQLQQAHTGVDRRRLEQRVARLGEAVGQILVGGITEQERRALKDKADDAVAAVRHARKAGVVPGGGASLLRAQEAVAREADKLTGDAATGARTLHDALEAPIRRIARNAGERPSVVLHRVRQMDPWGTWDALRREYVDAYASGLLDPLTTEIGALRAATSVGQMVLTTDAIVCERRPTPIPRNPRPATTRRPF